MALPTQVYTNESCRDAWQKFKDIIPTETKIMLIKKMIDTHPDQIQVASFGSAAATSRSQFFDTETVIKEILPYAEKNGVTVTALVGSTEGGILAMENGIFNVNYFIAVSEKFCEISTNGLTIADRLADLKKLIALDSKLKVVLAAGAVFGSPFGDQVEIENTRRYCTEAMDCGAYKLGLADSAGMSDPQNIRVVLQAIKKDFPVEKLQMHLHNTRGMGLANAFAALEEGVAHFDTAMAGMGGCPFIKGAKGNIPTEDFLNMAKTMGLTFSNDLDASIKLGAEISDILDFPVTSYMAGIYRTQHNLG